MTVVLDSRARRAVDLVLGVAGLATLGIPMIVLSAVIHRTSPGPAFFRQDRVGRGGRHFTIYKFRSMSVDAAFGPAVAGDNDSRVTAVGRWMRARRLDELPQLVNLIRGDMTLIGPRPEVPQFVEHYTDEERETLLVRPGVIGPGAVLFALRQADELNAAEDPERHYIEHQLHRKLSFDTDYLRSRTFLEDTRLLAAALGFVKGGTR